MSNFSYLKNKPMYKDFADDMIKIEQVFAISAGLCIIQARQALKIALQWIYKQEKISDCDMNLDEMITFEDFHNLVDEKTWNNLLYISKEGDKVTQNIASVNKNDAITILKNLFTFVQWIEQEYGFFPKVRTFDENKISLPDCDEETEENKRIEFFNHRLLKTNGSNNVYQDGERKSVCLEITLNAIVDKIDLKNSIISGIEDKNREWPVVKEQEPPAVNTETVTEETDADGLYTAQEQNDSDKIDFRELAELDDYDLERYLEEALSGNADAQYELGRSYYVEQSYEEAIKWFTKAAEQGDKYSKYYLGLCYYYGKGTKQDYTNAFKWFTKAARQGNANSQYYLGLCYYYGEGTKQMYTKAFKWFTEAAKQGEEYSKYFLGLCYYNGEGTKQDYTKAIECFTEAAEQGDADSQYYLGLCYYNYKSTEQDYTKAFKWFTEATKQGDKYSKYFLGLCYYNGEGTKQDYTKAIECFTEAAEQGDKYSQYYLGLCYYDDNGTNQDYTKAFKWFTEAAKQGNRYAQIALANCYEKGIGVKRDHNEAIKWYSKGGK